MSFSNHVALQVVDLDDAVDFYIDTLGMELVERTDAEVVLRKGAMTFHIEESSAGQTFFEFETDDLASARESMLEQGCELTPVTTPEGDESFLVTDPFGLKFHVFES